MHLPRATGRPPWWGELLAVAFLLVVYDRVANLADLHVTAALARGRQVLHLEALLHLAMEPRLSQFVQAHHRLGQVLSLYYDWAHGTVTVGVLLAGWLVAAPGYRAARRVLVAVNLVALAVFVVLPVAPPRLLPDAGVADVVARSGTWGAWDSSAAVAEHADQYASLPSLHVAWAVWVLLAAVRWTRSRRLRALAGAHVALTVVVVVVTGNHYLIDVVAGAALPTGLWLLRRRRPTPPRPPGSAQRAAQPVAC